MRNDFIIASSSEDSAELGAREGGKLYVSPSGER